MRKMTLSGSRAIVNRNSAMAGPKAMKVQPKNTDAVILALCGELGVQQRDWKRLVLFLKKVNLRRSFSDCTNCGLQMLLTVVPESSAVYHRAAVTSHHIM